MTPFDQTGIHARNFNSTKLGLEVLGNYNNKPEALSTRGVECWDSAAEYVAVIFRFTGWDPREEGRIVGHRDNGRTTKTCPGTFIDLDDFREVVADKVRMANSPALPPSMPALGQDQEDPDHNEERVFPDIKAILARVEAMEWQTKKLRELVESSKERV